MYDGSIRNPWIIRKVWHKTFHFALHSSDNSQLFGSLKPFRVNEFISWNWTKLKFIMLRRECTDLLKMSRNSILMDCKWWGENDYHRSPLNFNNFEDVSDFSIDIWFMGTRLGVEVVLSSKYRQICNIVKQNRLSRHLRQIQSPRIQKKTLFIEPPIAYVTRHVETSLKTHIL